MTEIRYKDKYEDINTNSMRIITKMLDDASEKNYVKIFRAKELLTYNEKHLFSEKVLNELLNDVNTELSKFDNTMFGYYLCSVRVKNKQTIKQAAKKMGITEGALRIYEAGEAYPSYSVVMILKNTYKISDDEILEAIERDEKTNILYCTNVKQKKKPAN